MRVVKGRALHASQAVLGRFCGLGAGACHHWRRMACVRRAGSERYERSDAAEAPTFFTRLARREEVERDEMSRRGGLWRASLEAGLLGQITVASGEPLSSGLRREI